MVSSRVTKVESSRVTKVESSRVTKVESSRVTNVERSRVTKVESSRVTKVESSRVNKVESSRVNQDLRYGEILAGRPGAWFVKRYILYVCNQKNKKGTYFEIQNLAFTVYDSRAYTDVFYGGTYPEKNV